MAIEDSKKLKGANGAAVHPLTHLERGVLSFAAAAAEGLSAFPDDARLLEWLNTSVPEEAWYASITPLPVAHDTTTLRIPAARLTRTLDRSRIACASLCCTAVDAAQFNEAFRRMRSKAGVNLWTIMQHIDRIWRRFPEAHPRVVVDRQSGRVFYREELALAYPEAQIQVLHEAPELSRYRLMQNGSMITISFQQAAEAKHFPVALASMTAKYVRELLMLRFNRYFAAKLPDLKATAGYNSDGRRYLTDIAPLIESLAIDRRRLVREA